MKNITTYFPVQDANFLDLIFAKVRIGSYKKGRKFQKFIFKNEKKKINGKYKIFKNT